MKRLYLFFLMFVFDAFSAMANDGSYTASGGQLVPAVETEISVQKEILTLKRNGDRLRVDVYYEFYNPLSTVKNLLVGFVAPPPSGDVEYSKDAFIEQPYISGFRVEMNGFYLNHKVALVHENEYDFDTGELVKDNTFKDGKPNALTQNEIDDCIKALEADDLWGYPFDYVYHFNAQFVPGVNIVKHTYEYELSSSVMHMFSFPYDLTPACRWANGQIDDFTLIIDMGDVASFRIPANFFDEVDRWKIHGIGAQKFDYEDEFYVNYAYRQFWIRDGYLEFNKKNFKPEGELNILKQIEFFPEDESELLQCILNGDFYDLDIDPDEWFWDGYSAQMARILKNLPFAYRGYVFKSKDLQALFERAPWYEPAPTYVPNVNALPQGEQNWVRYWADYKPKTQK